MNDRIDTFQDLLNLLDANPQWVQALRERLLTPELLELPEKFAAFTTMFANFADMVERRFQALEADMTEVKGDVATLKSDMTEVKGDLAILKGHAVPQAVHRMLGTLAEAANVRRPRWLDSAEVVNIADDAEDEGRTDTVPEGEMKSFKAIDLAITATDKTTKQQCYVVIECSYTVTKADADRAQRNASHMTRFTGIPAKAVIAGNVIPEQVNEYTQEIGVSCVLVTAKVSAPY